MYRNYGCNLSKFKLASGLGFVSEHWYTQEDTNPDHYGATTVNTVLDVI